MLQKGKLITFFFDITKEIQNFAECISQGIFDLLSDLIAQLQNLILVFEDSQAQKSSSSFLFLFYELFSIIEDYDFFLLRVSYILGKWERVVKKHFHSFFFNPIFCFVERL